MARYQAAHKEMFTEVKQRWARNNPEKRKAHVIVGHAIRSGKLVKLPCEACGSERSEAHHHDYSKPLDVVWLCRACHGEIHRRY